MINTQTKTTLRTLILLFVVFTSSCTSLQETTIEIDGSQKEHNERYVALVKEVKTKPTLEAVTKLRELVVLTNRQTPSAIEENLNQRQFAAIEAERWFICLDIANQALAVNYASISSHYGAMVCRLEAGDTVQGLYHESVMNLLLEAVWTTGNGESLETAFQIINRSDKHAFIEFHGLELIKQNITRLDGRDYYFVTVYDGLKDITFEWYFTQLN